MIAEYALLLVKRGFTDKYTGRKYKNGEVALFERKRAEEIRAVLGSRGVCEVAIPEGVALLPAADPEQPVAEPEQPTADETAEKPQGKKGKGSKPRSKK